MSTEHYK